MARLNVLAGDFKVSPNRSHWWRGKLLMKRNGKFFRESIHARQIERVLLASEEAVLSLGEPPRSVPPARCCSVQWGF